MKIRLMAVMLAFSSTSFLSGAEALSIAKSGNGVVLSVSGAASMLQIQYSSDLSPSSWQVLTNLSVVSNAVNVADSFATSRRFYRLLRLNKMVWINAGEFVMGSPNDEQDRQSYEGPQTIVRLTEGFYMSSFPVTQREYASIMGVNPSHFLGNENRPVEKVSWEDATNFCFKLTQRERQAGRMQTNWSYKLPTEAQWEYAARAGTTNRFFFGEDPSYSQLKNYAWYWENSGATNLPLGVSYHSGDKYYSTHPVGAKLQNAWGLHDMYGNVFQWCLDRFGNYPGGVQTNYLNSAGTNWHSFRGGAWSEDAPYCRSASRVGGNAPDNYTGALGFRYVLSLD